MVSNHATNPSIRDNMPYDALNDFESISMLARAPIVPYSSPKFAPTNVKELIAEAKAKPGTLTFGSAGPGSMTHLVAEMLKIQAGIDMTHVVYRGGTPAMNDVLAGQIPMTFATVTQALPQYQSGLMRALGVTSEKRYAAIPGGPDLQGAGRRSGRIGMVRAARAGQDAEAHHRQAQRRDPADHGDPQSQRPAARRSS